MHMVFLSQEGRLFVSHGFGGVWNSNDKEKGCHRVSFSARDVNFSSMTQFSNGILAGGGRVGLWISADGGATWRQLFNASEGCEVTSLSSYYPEPRAQSNIREKEIYLGDAPNAYRVSTRADERFLIGSSERGLWSLELNGKLRRLGDLPITSIYYSRGRLYLGTLDRRLLILTGTIHFFRPDPINKHKLWIGTRGVRGWNQRRMRGRRHSMRAGSRGSLITGIYENGTWRGLWRKPNYASSIAIDSSQRRELKVRTRMSPSNYRWRGNLEKHM